MKASENVKLGLAVKPLDRGKLAELGVRFAMGVALGRVRIFGSFAPFGPALVGAAPAGAAGIVTLAGACLGALTAGSLSWSLKYIAIDILIWTALHFFADAAPGYFPMALTFGLSLVIGFVYAWDSGFEIRATAMWVVESFAAGGFVFFYTAALSPWSNSQGRNVQAAHAAPVGDEQYGRHAGAPAQRQHAEELRDAYGHEERGQQRNFYGCNINAKKIQIF